LALTLGGLVGGDPGQGAGAGGGQLPTEGERQGRWAMVSALDRAHARGLLGVLAVGILASAVVVVLRQAPVVPDGAQSQSLAEAAFGPWLFDGYLVVPGTESLVALVIPLTLAPLALGTLTSIRRSGPMAVGGLAALVLAGVVAWLDGPAGRLVPVSVLEAPGLASMQALYPAGAGILVGASLVYVGRQSRWRRPAIEVGYALGAGLVAFALAGWLPAAALLLGVVVAAIVCAYTTHSAPLGAVLLLTAAAGWGLSHLVDPNAALAIAGIAAVTAIAAATCTATLASLPVPLDDVRTPATLAYVLVGLAGAGLVAVLVLAPVQTGTVPFPAPHAQALAASLEAVFEGQGLLLVAWGIAAGVALEALVGQAGWVALGVLAGPGVALFVLAGSLGRALLEQNLLDNAREGFVTRGELGYTLLRLHVLVVGLLVGEGLAVAGMTMV
jgi:hypothetical protein